MRSISHRCCIVLLAHPPYQRIFVNFSDRALFKTPGDVGRRYKTPGDVGRRFKTPGDVGRRFKTPGDVGRRYKTPGDVGRRFKIKCDKI
jgi:hypothetical protein